MATVKRTAPVTVGDIESYLQGLEQTGNSSLTAPYTVYNSTGKAVRTLTQSQLATTMKSLGYSAKQIASAKSGSFGGSSGLGSTLTGVAAGLAAMGPEGGGALSDIVTGGSEIAGASQEESTSPADTSTAEPGTTEDTTTGIKPTEAPKDEAPSAAQLGVQGLAPAGVGLSYAIGSVTDFLSWIAWLFNPLNWLRLVEFIFGTILMFYGFHLLFQRRPLSGTGAGIERVTRDVAAATPIGRAANIRRGRRMGRPEGQVEEGRLQGRRQGRTEAQARQTRAQNRRNRRQ